MKKIATTLALTLFVFIARAQDHFESGNELQLEMFRAVSVIFTVFMFMIFIITLLKMFMENRLKHKIVDKGVPEETIASILRTNPTDERQSLLKWFFILAGIGLGLTIVNYTQPIGIHSMATMAFSLSASFLGYYFFTRKAAS